MDFIVLNKPSVIVVALLFEACGVNLYTYINLKALNTIGDYSTYFVSINIYLVMSNGELLIV